MGYIIQNQQEEAELVLNFVKDGLVQGDPWRQRRCSPCCRHLEGRKQPEQHRRGRGDERAGLLPMRHVQGHTDQWHPHAITDGTSGRNQGTRRV